MVKSNIKLIGGFLAGIICAGGIAYAGIQSNYLGSVFISDPTTPTQQMKINSDGSINTTASGGGSAPVTTTGTLVTGQVTVAATGTAVQLPAHAGLVNGVLICAFGGWPSSASSPSQHVNTNGISIGSSSVGNACDGTGTGDCIPPGACHGYAVNNTNLLWENGVISDGLSFEGN